MAGSTESAEKIALRQLQEIEALLEKWKHATDAESVWALSLLRQAAVQIRRELRLPTSPCH
jgi:hypothetical protein